MNLGIWEKLNRLMVVLLFLAGGVAVFYCYLPLIQQSQRYRKEILLLDLQLAEEMRLDKQLSASTDAYLHDRNVLERLAREKLGYARTNETVIRFEPPERFQRPGAKVEPPASKLDQPGRKVDRVQ